MGKIDLLRSRLDQIINMRHELVRLATTLLCGAIKARWGKVYSDAPGMVLPGADGRRLI